MAANDASGVGNASGVRSSLGELDALFTAVKRGEKELKSAKEAEAALVKKLQTHTAEANKSATASMKLANAVKELRAGSEASKEGAKSLAAELSGSVGIMTTAQAQNREAYRKSLETIIAQTQALDKNKETNRDIAILAREKANVEMEIMEDTIKERRSMVSAYAQSGQGFRAVGSAMSANLMATGAQVGKLGQYVGATGASMAGMAAVAGVAIGAFAIFSAWISKTAETARDAAKAGVSFADFRAATQYGFAAQVAAKEQFNLFVSSKELQDAQTESMQNYGFGLLATGNAYAMATKASDTYRNDLINNSFEFVSQAGKVGLSLGMSLQEGVQMATRMGVLAKGGSRDTLLAFSYMGAEARRLGVPITALGGVFEVLAANADHLGSNSRRLAADTVDLMNMMVDLKDKGIKGFNNLDPEKMQRAAKNLATFVAGMDEIRLAAITQKPGEGAFDALSRVEGMQVGDRANVIRDFAKEYGINTKLTGPGKAGYEDFYGLAAMLGFQGTPTEMKTMGVQLAQLSRKKNFGQGELRDLQAEMLQSRFDASQTVGKQLAMGANPMGVMANLLSELLKVVVGIANSSVLKANPDAKRLAESFKRSGKEDTGKKYGSGVAARSAARVG